MTNEEKLDKIRELVESFNSSGELYLDEFEAFYGPFVYQIGQILNGEEKKEAFEVAFPLLESFYLSHLQRIVTDYVKKRYNGEWVSDDDKHYIFEEAIIAFYGGDVWDKLNELPE